MYALTFIGKLVIKYLQIYHCSKPTSFTKSVIHPAPSLLNKPLLSAYHMPNTRDERMRNMSSMFSKSSQSGVRDQEATGKWHRTQQQVQKHKPRTMGQRE